MSDNDTTVEIVPPATSVRLPVYALKGALQCASTDTDARRYLASVFLHRHEDALRIVSTDGSRLFVCSIEGADWPDWLASGVLIPADDLKPRLAFIEKMKCSTAVISYATGAGSVCLESPTADTMFKMEPVDGTFPDYQTGIIDRSMGAFTREATADFEAVGFKAEYLKAIGDVSKIFGGKKDQHFVRVFCASPEEPTVITFQNAPGVVLYLMPSKIATPLAPQTAKLLEGPISGTLAALRAHRTRWEQKLDGTDGAEREAIEEKIAEYTGRIKGIMTRALPPALPAPEAKPEPKAGLVKGNGTPEDDPMPADELPDPRELLRDHRRRLSVKRRRTMARDFLSNVRVALHTRHDLSGNLANAAEIDEKFSAGFTLDEVVAEIVTEARGPVQEAEPRPETFEAFCVAIDEKLATQSMSLDSLADNQFPIRDWFDAGLTVTNTIARMVEWMEAASSQQKPEDNRPEEDAEAAANSEPAPKPEQEPVSEDGVPAQEDTADAPRPDSVGDFINAVMAQMEARSALAQRNSWRRKITAAATAGFADGSSVGQVVTAFCSANPTQFAENVFAEAAE